jgi:hypothetical protein
MSDDPEVYGGGYTEEEPGFNFPEEIEEQLNAFANYTGTFSSRLWNAGDSFLSQLAVLLPTPARGMAYTEQLRILDCNVALVSAQEACEVAQRNFESLKPKPQEAGETQTQPEPIDPWTLTSRQTDLLAARSNFDQSQRDYDRALREPASSECYVDGYAEPSRRIRLIFDTAESHIGVILQGPAVRGAASSENAHSHIGRTLGALSMLAEAGRQLMVHTFEEERAQAPPSGFLDLDTKLYLM